MLLDSTTENLYISLSNTITTNQLQFYCSYNTITTTTLTPNKNQGTTSDTTPVVLMPAPSSNQQNQLRHCSIQNVDTKANSVLIQYSGATGTANILNVSLLPNESIQYTTNNGWQVYNDNGILKVLGAYDVPNSLRAGSFIKPVNSTTVLTVVSGTDYVVHLGKADRRLTTIKLNYRVTTSPTTITWSEIGIYKGSPTLNGATTALSFCGFADVSGVVNSTGIKTTTITVTGVTINDDLYAVFGSVHTVGTYALRAALADDLGAGFFSTVTGSLRPSTNSTITVNTDNSTAVVWCAWQGLQW